MKTSFAKTAIWSLASILLATLLTLNACDSGGGDNGNNAEKYDYCLLAEQKECLVGPFELSTCNGQLSNSCPSDYDTGSLPSSSSGSGKGNSSSSTTSNGGNETSGSITYEGQTYKTVKIGEQVWMAENLNYNAEGSVCYGDATGGDSQGNCAIYGRLYTWETAKTVCPTGWKLPDNDEWAVLVKYADPSWIPNDTNNVVGKYLKAMAGWRDAVSGGNGEDTFGFAALPCGVYNDNGVFQFGGESCGWWSNAESNTANAYMYTANSANNYSELLARRKTQMRGVRCVSGTPAEVSSSSSVVAGNQSSSSIGGTGTFTYQGQTYKTVVIGSQTWMAENLNYITAEGGYICYDGDSKYCDKYGRLYTWATAMALPTSCNTTLSTSNAACTINAKHKGICPVGWHIPTGAEWNELYHYADGTLDGSTDLSSNYNSPTAGMALKPTSGWFNGNGDPYGNGTDEYEFAALPGGAYNPGGIPAGRFDWEGSSGWWWSASESSASNIYIRYMRFNDSEAACFSDQIKGSYFSLRCVKDD